eukprot:SAG11_NODE_23354_length_390_cov_0.756014_1_plen_108_part_10
MSKVACMASAATRNSVWYNPSVGMSPDRCLRLAVALGVPARVVYDYDTTETWLDGVSLLVLDRVRCLSRPTLLRISAWAGAGSRMIALKPYSDRMGASAIAFWITSN